MNIFRAYYIHLPKESVHFPSMVDRTCERCGKEFKYPAHLREHLARKTPCAPILEPEDLPEEVRDDPDYDKKKCHFCGRAFANYTSKRRHIRNTCKIAPMNATVETPPAAAGVAQ